MKKFAFYCSGGASRILKFYSVFDIGMYPAAFVYYDGNNKLTFDNLNKIFSNKLVTKHSENSPDKNSISDLLLHLLKKNEVDYLFCFGDKILRSPLIDIYKNRIVNFHPSLLPAFPGLNAIDQALASSVQLLGNTAHFIDKDVDSGPIIMQSVISRSVYKEYEDVLAIQIDMLKTIWDLLNEDRIKVKNNRVIIETEIKQKPPFFSI